MNQDSLGIQASCKLNCVFNSSDPYAILTEPQVYAGPLAGGDLAVIIVNWSPFTFNKTLVISMLDLGLELGQLEEVTVRDLWAHQDVGVLSQDSDSIRIEEIPAYGNYAYRIKRSRNSP